MYIFAQIFKYFAFFDLFLTQFCSVCPFCEKKKVVKYVYGASNSNKKLYLALFIYMKKMRPEKNWFIGRVKMVYTSKDFLWESSEISGSSLL